MSIEDSMRRTIAEQHDEIGALKAENAKLREELAKWELLAAGIDLPEYPVTQFKPKDLERENAKLRELVRDMWRGMCGYAHNCFVCSHYQPIGVAPGECEFFTRMRELGIEVDG